MKNPNYQLATLIDMTINENPEWADEIKLLAYEIDKRLLYYGSHFSKPYEKPCIKISDIFYKSLFRIAQSLKNEMLALLDSIKKGHSQVIMSNAYFGIANLLKSENSKVIKPYWLSAPVRRSLFSRTTNSLFRQLQNRLSDSRLRVLINIETFVLIRKFSLALKKDIAGKVDALLIPNDESFWERLSAGVFRTAEIKTGIFLHGLPARYNTFDENRTDFLFVWGEAIKTNYILAGFDAKKIIVVGHPNYQMKNRVVRTIDSNLDRVLVISYSLPGGRFSDVSDRAFLPDRESLLVYVKSIKTILQGLGYNSARLRVHPSENPKFYLNADDDYFEIDTDPLIKSIKSSTLIIGAPSTLMLEAMYYHTPVIIYEPNINGNNIIGFNIVSPFNGADENILVADTPTKLSEYIKNKNFSAGSNLHEYLGNHFDLNAIKDALLG